MMTFTVTNTATELNVSICANSLTEAEYKAYTIYGMDAIGCNVSCNDNNSFACTVVKKAWEEVLERYFEGFTMDDVLNHLIVVAYAWLNFEHEHYSSWDCEGKRLCEDGLKYIYDHSSLAVRMKEIGFEW